MHRAVNLHHPLKSAAQLFNGACSEHRLEDITVGGGSDPANERCRILRPGAVLRLSVPSLEACVDYYRVESTRENFERFQLEAEALWSLNHTWDTSRRTTSSPSCSFPGGQDSIR